MKTTVEIPDDLFRETRLYAAQQGIPLREVIERGLRAVVRNEKSTARPFRLKTLTIKGDPAAAEHEWSRVRARIYEGHGG